MQSGKTVTGGVVLRVTDTKETDRILTALTADRGKIPLIARGARRKNSRLAAACQMPAYSELTIFKRGSWYMLDEASPIELFDGLGRDIELLALAACAAVLLALVRGVETVTAFVREVMQCGGVESALFAPLFKTVAIALISRTGADLCRDAGEGAMASLV